MPASRPIREGFHTEGRVPPRKSSKPTHGPGRSLFGRRMSPPKPWTSDPRRPLTATWGGVTRPHHLPEAERPSLDTRHRFVRITDPSGHLSTPRFSRTRPASQACPLHHTPLGETNTGTRCGRTGQPRPRTRHPLHRKNPLRMEHQAFARGGSRRGHPQHGIPAHPTDHSRALGPSLVYHRRLHQRISRSVGGASAATNHRSPRCLDNPLVPQGCTFRGCLAGLQPNLRSFGDGRKSQEISRRPAESTSSDSEQKNLGPSGANGKRIGRSTRDRYLDGQHEATTDADGYRRLERVT